MTAVERWLESKGTTTWQTGHDLTDPEERRQAAVWFIEQMVSYQRFSDAGPEFSVEEQILKDGSAVWSPPSIVDHEEWMASGPSPRLRPSHQGPEVSELPGTSPDDPEFWQAMELMDEHLS